MIRTKAYRWLSRQLRVEVDSLDLPLSTSYSIRVFNVIILTSVLSAFLFGVFSFLVGTGIQAMLSFISIPVFLLVLNLSRKGRYATAKLIFSTFVLFLIVFFSLMFGKGFGSEYWILVMGGLSLLIFDKRKNSQLLVFVALLCFFVIEMARPYIHPIGNFQPEIKRLVLAGNVVFIFVIAFVISFVLRGGSEKFEEVIKKRNRILQLQNKDLTDSINYAKRIQKAILPSPQLLSKYPTNFFVLFEPKDIVSGDFYWIYPLYDKILFAVVDGAGHSVSGALTSIMSHTMLTQCVEEFQKTEPIDLYYKFRELIILQKEKWNDFLIEDLEISICSYGWQDFQLEYASNGNFMYLIKHINNVEASDELTIIPNDRYVLKEIRKSYEINESPRLRKEPFQGQFTFRKDDMLYLTTDGMARQLGGPKYKKLKAKRLKDLLMSVQHFNLKKQEQIIRDVLSSWRGKSERTDDVTILGFKI